MNIKTIDQSNRKAINSMLIERWQSLVMIVHGEAIDIGRADGIYAEERGEIVGLVTYRLRSDKIFEILSFDTFQKKQGIGSALLDKITAIAKELDCISIVLETTNDNTEALRFYQKHGFDITAFHRDEMDNARKMKPEIPLVGNDGIPLRHVFALELRVG